MTGWGVAFRTTGELKTEVETIAQAAAHEELAAFLDAILNTRLAAEKAAIFLGGHTQSRFERVIDAVNHARSYVQTMALTESAANRRSVGRRVDPPFVLKERPEPGRECRVKSATDLAMPLNEALELRDQGLSWRQIRERMLVAVGD
jgi:hypothetical protein